MNQPTLVRLFCITLLFASAAVAGEEKSEPLEKGDKVPEVSLTSLEGASVDLKTVIEKQPTILIFYRGGWCPFCTKHLAAVGTVEPRLKELGYQIIAVAPDKPEEGKPYAEQQDLNYEIYSDPTAEVAQGFGVTFRVSDEIFEKYKGFGVNLEERSGQDHRLLPHPSVFIIGTDGVIDFSYWNEDYAKGRISAEDLVKAAEEARD